MARWARSRTVTFGHRVEALGIRVGMGALRLLPAAMALRFGSLLGETAFQLGVRRKVVLDNIARAAGLPRDPGARLRVARASYRNYGRCLAEYMHLEGVPDEASAERLSYDGLEHFVGAVREGRGVIAVSGHFGALELLASGFRAVGVKPVVLAAPMRNPLAADVFKRHWERCGLEVVEVGPGLRAAFGVLKRGGVLCMAADQDAGRHGVFVNFLGRPASTPPGSVELALRTGAPIVFGLIFRRPGGGGVDRHFVQIRPPLVVEARGSHEETVRHYLQTLADYLAEGVVAQPDQWFWFHRRWKTQPRA